MAVDRMIRASMRESEKVAGWPFELRYFWTQLWGYCDDFGRGRYESRLIKAGTFPLEDDVTSERVGRWMQALELAGVIQAYEVGGKRYFEVVNWHEHQEIPYFKKSDVPDRSGGFSPTGKRSEVLQKILESSVRIEVEVEREIEGESAHAQPPGTLSPFCANHPSGSGSDCRACGDARRLFDATAKAARDKPTPIPPRGEPTLCEQHTWMPDGTCLLCVARRRDEEVA